MRRYEIWRYIIKYKGVFYSFGKFRLNINSSIRIPVESDGTTMLHTVINNIIILRINLCYTSIPAIPWIDPEVFPGIRKIWLYFIWRSKDGCIILCSSINSIVFLIDGDIIKFTCGNVVVMKP